MSTANPMTRAYEITPDGFRRPVDDDRGPDAMELALNAIDLRARVAAFLAPYAVTGRVPVAHLVAAGLSEMRLRARVGSALRDLGWERRRIWSREAGQQWYWVALNPGTRSAAAPVVGVE